ncbi:hypothetical protein BD626DRAFT_634630 [Schizophyllum amplum]|uniref:MYND-type domain-containing protein n=1 Tax=Schizophyllum amplum TaxID=97359 RepID=A0A550BYK1_9AGAR|nr:hypothetical protein BD626DRAFT_634630 [Auriculariopsis ampla]
MPGTPIWRTFLSVYALNEDSIPHHLLTPILARKLFSCLKPERIPAHPFDEVSTTTIMEALDALYIYCRFCYHLNSAPASFQQTLAAPFPDIWQWIVFICPQSGNVIDMPPELEGRQPCGLLPDGNVAVALQFRFGIISPVLRYLADNARGRKELLATPDLMHVILAMLTHAAHPTPSVATWQHRLYALVDDLLHNDSEAVSRRAHADTVEFDNNNPGIVICTIAQRLAWFFRPECESPEDAEYVACYSKFFAKDVMANSSMVVNLQTASPIPSLVRMLFWATSLSDWPSPTAHKQHIVFRWMSLLKMLLSADRPDSEATGVLKEALHYGLLPVLDRLLHLRIRDGEADALWHAENLRSDAESIINLLLPAIVWPNVLRAFQAAVRKDQTDFDFTSKASDSGPWIALGTRFKYYSEVKEACKKHLADVRNACANPQCSGRYGKQKMKMCPCALAFYCSKQCQKTHWHAAHRYCCYRDHNGPLATSRDTADHRMGQNTVTHAERFFLKRCAQEYMLDYGDPDSVRKVRTIMVDLINSEEPTPIITYGIFDDTAPAVQDPDPNMRYTHTWVRVQRGPLVIIMEVEVWPQQAWIDAAGCRKKYH